MFSMLEPQFDSTLWLTSYISVFILLLCTQYIVREGVSYYINYRLKHTSYFDIVKKKISTQQFQETYKLYRNAPLLLPSLSVAAVEFLYTMYFIVYVSDKVERVVYAMFYEGRYLGYTET